jgi:hypothetical protein
VRGADVSHKAVVVVTVRFLWRASNRARDAVLDPCHM